MDPITGLLDAIDALAAADPQTHEARMVLEATLQASRDDALGAPYRAMLLDLRGLIADRVRRARDAGRAPGHLDASATAVTLAALLDGLALHRMLDPDTDVGAAKAFVAQALGASS